MPSRSKSKRPTRTKRSKTQAAAREKRDALSASASLFEAGMLAYQLGQMSTAVESMRELLQSDPMNGNAWHVLGLSLYASNQVSEAIDCLQYAMQFCPDDPEIQSNTAAVLHSVGDLALAQQLLETTTKKHPQHAGAAINLAAVYLDQDNVAEAEKLLSRALILDPNSITAKMNLGNVWMRQNRVADAERQYRMLAKRNPVDLNLRINWAESLRKLGDFENAIDVLSHVVNAEPLSLKASITMARCLIELRRCNEAKTILEKARHTWPSSAQIFHYLGQMEFVQGNLTNAEDALMQAAELAPADGYIRSRLGITLLELGKRDDAIAELQKAVEINPLDATSHSFLMFTLSGDESVDPKALFESHLEWGRSHGAVEPNTRGLLKIAPDYSPNRRLRIGYVSPDFCSHAVSLYFEPVLAQHSPEVVETFCYSETDKPDQVTQRLQNFSDHWRVTRGQSDFQVAQQIAADKIDILVDLAGHTANNRLLVFPYRAAPVQMTWLGYPNTTGLDCIDYRITCATQSPIDEPSYHSEQLIRMPRVSCCFSCPQFEAPNNELPALKNGYLTFGSLHRPSKISSKTYDIWAGVLRELPSSRMVMYNTRFKAETKRLTLDELESRGIDRQRVEVRSRPPVSDYLETYHDIDIALDVTPWTGATTTLGAIWMGVPVIAFDGGRRSARSTVAIVNAIGQPDWIARSLREYVEKSVALAHDLTMLSGVRNRLRNQLESSVLDSTRFTRELEFEYRKAWIHCCQSH
jgi:predicted O-linked N-acetylglucosamine transferase (SPINDLY family)